MRLNKIVLFLALASLSQTNIIVAGKTNRRDSQHTTSRVERLFREHCFHAFSGLVTAFFMHNEIQQNRHRPAYGWHRNPNFFYSVGTIAVCHSLQGIKSFEHVQASLNSDRIVKTTGKFFKNIIAPTLGALSLDCALRGWMYDEKESKHGAFWSLFGGLVAYKIGSSFQDCKKEESAYSEDC